jgi:hypothetical protein
MQMNHEELENSAANILQILIDDCNQFESASDIVHAFAILEFSLFKLYDELTLEYALGTSEALKRREELYFIQRKAMQKTNQPIDINENI